MSEVNKFSSDFFDDEDFLNKIANRKKRMKYKFFTRLVFFILIWATLLVYYLTPVSKVGNINVIGNYYLTANDVLTLSEMNPKIHLVRVDQEKIKDKLSESPRIKHVDVKWSPFKLTITLNEIVPIAKSIHSEVILSNGELLNEYLVENPTYDLDGTNLHLAKFIHSPFIQETRQIAFLENLKIIDKPTFSNIDYLDITFFEGSNTMFFGIYVKILDKTYVRIRATVDVLKELYETHTLNSVINSYTDFTKKEDANAGISYHDATCRKSEITNKLQCVRL